MTAQITRIGMLPADFNLSQASRPKLSTGLHREGVIHTNRIIVNFLSKNYNKTIISTHFFILSIFIYFRFLMISTPKDPQHPGGQLFPNLDFAHNFTTPDTHNPKYIVFFGLFPKNNIKKCLTHKCRWAYVRIMQQ
ncbi:MAG TPA: hypothetical protein DHV36_19820 [Desulfobacteraceae bacterium]|nr:hypothetical protein [Desulfobacteraceae bacterium]